MEKLLPQNIEAECGVLGSIIIDPEAIVSVIEFLQPADFYRDAHRTLYEAMVDLYQRHEPADYLAICDDLERHGKLEQVGGPAYITSLIHEVPTSANIEFYGHIVEREATYRRLIHAAGQIAANAYERDTEALPKAEALIYQLSQGRQVQSVSSINDVLSRFQDRLDKIHDSRKHGTVYGVPTGFTHLDHILGGLQPSDMVTLAARPGVGKTSWALNVARHAMKEGYRVLMFSLEMAEEQLARRLVSMETHIDQTRLRTAEIEEGEWDEIVRAEDRLREGALWIDDSATLTPLDMRSRARRIQGEHGLDLVIVDYLQLAKATGKQENRVQEVSQISLELKGLARELNVPVLALAQLSRAVEQRGDKIPQLSDLKESGAIEQDSDVVMFLHCADDQLDKKMKSEPYNINVIVAKHRNGQVGIVPLQFVPKLTQFRGMEAK